MDIYQQAKELGEALLKTEEYVRFEKAEKAQAEDKEAMALIESYNKTRAEMGKKIAGENPTPEEVEAIRNKLQAEFEKLYENKVISEYIEANKAFMQVLQTVNTIIDHTVSGEQGCTGSCGSCGGCH